MSARVAVTKMHGARNDFIVLDARKETVDSIVALARRLCDRHTGIGADGLLLEVHPNPEKAISDGAQSLKLDDFRTMMNRLRPYIDLWKESRVAAAGVAV